MWLLWFDTNLHLHSVGTLVIRPIGHTVKAIIGEAFECHELRPALQLRLAQIMSFSKQSKVMK